MNTITDSMSKSHSLKTRITWALFALVVIQGLVFIYFTSLTGVIKKNNVATYNIMANQSVGRKSEIQNILNTKRINITNLALQLSSKVERILTDINASIDSLDTNNELKSEVLALSLQDLISFTKYNAVTGAFVVLDDPAEVADESIALRTSIYIRDSSPGIPAENNSNLMMEYGHVEMGRVEGIAVNYLWTRDMVFSDGYNKDFYFKPVNAALEGYTPDTKLQIFGYWNPPFTLKPNDVSIVTYSLPLILSDGTVYGVVGFEIETNDVGALMSAIEIPFEQGFYLMGVDLGDGLNTNNVFSSSAYSKQFLIGDGAKLTTQFVFAGDNASVYEITNECLADNKVIAAYNELALYEPLSPFFRDKWVLLCAAPQGSVMSGSDNIKTAIAISIVSTTALALIFAVFVVSYIFAPIHRLSEKVKSINPEKPVRFDRSGLAEIDELSAAFEVLSDGVSKAAAKMFKIVELVDLPLGSFEINPREAVMRLSKSLFRLTKIDEPEDGSLSIPTSEWDKFLCTLEEDSVTSDDDGINETLYVTDSTWESRRWFRVRSITHNRREIGVLMDVTTEITQKLKVEFERDYDSLTKLLNRHAFSIKAAALAATCDCNVGIMMFADLDDLKFINDTYGHSTGDEYIKSFADFLMNFWDMGAIVGRISGDEFAMFMCGFDTRDEARAAFDKIYSNLKSLSITTPDGSIYKTRASAGLAYYPEDSQDVKELLKYADYAMYEIKHSIKGELSEFDLTAYNKNSFVINMKNTLNLFIDEKRVRFAFQPIVDVKTGEIYAYEALMRSMVSELKSPDDVLKIARSQSKLYQIEKLTFTVVFDWISENTCQLEGKKIFVNSIPNQIFTESDLDEICSKYGYLFNRVVFEVTENEFSNKEETKGKMDVFRKLGAMVAIDDYGSGYSNELILLCMEPDFIKVDMSIVRNIDRNADKQQLAQNIISYAVKKGIKVIAEGVETRAELETLVLLGADYIQGYYLAKPSFEIYDIPDELKDVLFSINNPSLSVTDRQED